MRVLGVFGVLGSVCNLQHGIAETHEITISTKSQDVFSRTGANFKKNI